MNRMNPAKFVKGMLGYSTRVSSRRGKIADLVILIKSKSLCVDQSTIYIRVEDEAGVPERLLADPHQAPRGHQHNLVPLHQQRGVYPAGVDRHGAPGHRPGEPYVHTANERVRATAASWAARYMQFHLWFHTLAKIMIIMITS
jgi:hypothetical protein